MIVSPTPTQAARRPERRRRPRGHLARAVAIALLLVAVLRVDVATAHDIPSQSVMNAFVKIEPDQAHLVIRVPLLLLGTMSFPANARRELELAQAGPATQRSLAAIAQEVVLREDGEPLGPSSAVGRLALPSDRSFASYDEAVAHIKQPVAAGTTIYADQGFFDAHLTYPIASPSAEFTLRTMMLPSMGEGLTLAIRFIPLDGPTRAHELTSEAGEVALDPRWHQAAWIFVKSGFFHILDGIDHLLFLLCLVLPFRRLRSLLPVVTSFTVAHSITLVAAASGVVPAGAWFSPLIETLIAASIIYMALENVIAADLRRRWLITGAFGLVHGFGFASGLSEQFQFAGAHLWLSLLAFNVGVELGQIAVLLLVVPTLGLLVRHVLAQRVAVVLISVLVAHTAWHWMLDRANGLRGVDWPSPVDSPEAVLAAWAGLLALIGAATWLATARPGRRATTRRRAAAGGLGGDRRERTSGVLDRAGRLLRHVATVAETGTAPSQGPRSVPAGTTDGALDGSPGPRPSS